MAKVLEDHLCRVSKNFCSAIQGLRPPYREWIALSYLLLRILDTIEDSDWPDLHLQDESFAHYESFFERAPLRREVEAWTGRFPPSLTPAERHLILDSYRLLKGAHGLPGEALDIIRRTVVTMAAGMKIFLHRESAISSLEDLNLYCFFVAGLVAELLVDLLALLSDCLRVDEGLIVGARNFGVALQKVNILNDRELDATHGRVFAWSTEKVLASLGSNVRRALGFFARIPEGEKEFRLFCQVSLLGALASLTHFERQEKGTMDRSCLMRTVGEIGHDPIAMEVLTREIRPELWSHAVSDEWAALEEGRLERTSPKIAARVLMSYFIQTRRARPASIVPPV